MERSGVHIIATGGTIASTPSGMLTAEELVNAVPNINVVADLSTEQFLNIGSSRMTPGDWVRLAMRIQAIFATRSNVQGIVVTHGTDSLEETAYFLHLTVDRTRPVIVTGAMRDADSISPDGSANLYQAIRLAGSPDTQERGTLVLMNDEVHAARDVTKAHTLRLNAFASPVVGALGVVDEEAITWYRQPLRPQGASSPFSLPQDQTLPRVDIVFSYAGADDQQIRASVAAGARGIVMASFGAGRVTEAQEKAIREVLEQEVIVVFSSRVGSGRVEQSYENGLAPAGTNHRIVLANDLNPQKARILLMLALTKTADPQQIQALFDTH